MARQIDTGIRHITKIQQDIADRQQARAVVDLRHRLYSQLVGMPGHSRDDNHKFCMSLEGLTTQQRRAAIEGRFGAICRERAEPLLLQLESLGV